MFDIFSLEVAILLGFFEKSLTRSLPLKIIPKLLLVDYQKLITDKLFFSLTAIVTTYLETKNYNLMKYIIPLFFLISACHQLLGQDKKGNELYDNFGYSSAAEEYQNLEESELTYEIKEKLANSFRLNSQFETAEYWYAQIIQEATNPNTILNYAQVLQSNDKCEDAIRWYKAYQEKSEDTQRSFIEDCKDLEKIEKHHHIKVENLGSLNSDKHDFSPIPYKNGLVFTSMRESKNNLVDQWTNSSFSDLYFTEKNGTSFSKPIPLEGDVNGEFHDGVATFDPIRNEMIFTRNTTASSNSKGSVKHLEIFVAKKKDKEWKMPTKLFDTDETFSSCPVSYTHLTLPTIYSV